MRFSGVLFLSSLCFLSATGCTATGKWAAEELVTETKEDLGEDFGLIKSKEDLRKEIADLEKKLEQQKAETRKLEERLLRLKKEEPRGAP